MEALIIRPDPVFQRVRADEFTGRHWLTAQLDEYLAARRSGVFVVIGEAGVGKTAFLAHLVRERDYPQVFAEQAPGDANLKRALLSLGAQLALRYPLGDYASSGTLSAVADAPDFLARLLRVAVSHLAPGEKLVIVCDGLDEAGTAADGNVLGLPAVLPDRVFLVLSRRPLPVKLHFAEITQQEVVLDPTSGDNVQDMQAYLGRVAARPDIAVQLRAADCSDRDFIQRLAERSAGVWMYLYYVIQEIAAGRRLPRNLESLPLGLAGYYGEFWARYRSDADRWDAVVAPLLATLAVAREPLSLLELLDWAEVDAKPYAIRRLIDDEWRAFIRRDEQRYSLYHASLRDFLTGQVARLPSLDDWAEEMRERARAAHRRRITRWRAQCDGDWIRLADDDYARRHLVRHLAGAGLPDVMSALVVASAAWAQAREEREGSYAGFLADLNQVWEHASTDAGWNVGRQIRCALLATTVRSLAGNMPPELLNELIRQGRWSPARTLALIGQIPGERERAQAMERVAAWVPVELAPEMLALVRSIASEEARTAALVGITPYLPESLRVAALTLAKDLANATIRGWTLAQLGEHLPAALQSEVMAALAGIEDPYLRMDVLVHFAARQPEPVRSLAFAAAIRAAYDWEDEDRGGAIKRLAAAVPKETLGAVARLAYSLADKEWRASAIKTIAPFLPEDDFAAALKAVRAISTVDDRRIALIGLAPYLPVALQPEAITIAREIAHEHTRAGALTALAPHLSGIAGVALVAAARGIRQADLRARTLLRLAQHLADVLKVEVTAEALADPEFWLDQDSLQVLAGLGAGLPVELRLKALTLLEKSASNSPERVWTLIALAQHLPEEGQAAALRAASALSPADRLLALAHLAGGLREPFGGDAVQECLALVPTVRPYQAAKAVAALAATGPAAWHPRALAMCSLIADDEARIGALSALLPHVSGELLPDALVTLLQFRDSAPAHRARQLLRVVPRLPDGPRAGVLAQALEAVRAIVVPDDRAQLLLDLVPHTTGDLRARALAEAASLAGQTSKTALRADLLLQCARATDQFIGELSDVITMVRDSDDWAWQQADLFPRLPRALRIGVLAETWLRGDRRLRGRIPAEWTEAERAEALDAALAGARVIGDGDERAAALVSLIRQLPGSAQSAVVLASGLLDQVSARPRIFQELGAALPEPRKAEALQTILAIASETERGRALVGLAPHLPISLQAETLRQVANFQQESVRTETLTGLFAYLPDDLKRQAFDLIRTVRYDDQRSQALIAIAPHLPTSLLAEALALTAELAGGEWGPRGRVLASLAPHLPEDWLRAALESLSAPQWSQDRARALVELAPYLSDPQRVEALALARTIAEPGPRAWALGALVARLAPLERDRLVRDIWPAVEQVAAEPYRAWALASLVSSIPEGGKSQALRDIMTRLRRKEPRAAWLLPLLPHLPDELKGEAVALMRGIPGEADRAWGLTRLAPYLSGDLKVAVLRDALEAGRHRDDNYRLQVIEWVIRELPLEYRFEALESARGLNDIWRDRALASVFPHLPPELKVRLLIEAQTRDSALASLRAAARREAVADLGRAHWRAALQGLSTGGRQQFFKVLAALAPLIEACGGQAALEEAIDAVCKVTTWWP